MEFHSKLPKNEQNKVCPSLKQQERSLSPWLMYCVQNKWDEISKIIKFEKRSDGNNACMVSFVDTNTKIEDLCKNDKNYDNLEVYAGIFGICNFVFSLRNYKDGSYDGKEGFAVDDSVKKLACDDELEKYSLKGRLNLWDKFKESAIKGNLKNNEEK